LQYYVLNIITNDILFIEILSLLVYYNNGLYLNMKGVNVL